MRLDDPGRVKRFGTSATVASRSKREQFVEFSSLAVFAAIAAERSLTAAGKSVGLTQSAVSQVLKQIENSMGVDLVDRSARPLRITPAGLRFLAYAEATLSEARKITGAVRESARLSLPTIRLGLIDSFTSTFGPHLVPYLQGRAEQLILRSGINVTMREALLSRELDLVVSTDPFDAEENLERHELCRDPLLLVTPSEYNNLSLDGLRGVANQLPLIRYSRRSSFGVQIDVHLRRLGIEPANRFEIDTSDALLSMVCAGPGWAVTSAICFLQARNFIGKARATPLPGPPASRRVYLVARRGEHGDMPGQVAQICRSILDNHLLPELLSLLPWIDRDVFSFPSEAVS